MNEELKGKISAVLILILFGFLVLHFYQKSEERKKLIPTSSYKHIKDAQYFRDFWPNGADRSREPMVDGVREGIAEYYHDNGQLYSFIRWVGGKKNGKYVLFREDGTLEQILEYQDGKMHGKGIWFDSNYRVTAIAHYEKGIPHGTTTYYNPDGSVKSTVNYVLGVAL